MTPWNDNNACILSNGNISLGFSGQDDAAYDTVQTYAKSDVFWMIPPSACMVAGGPTSAYAAPTMAARQTIQAGTGGTSMAILLDSGKSGSQFVLIPFNFFQRTTRTGPNNASVPHGFKLKRFQCMYSVLQSNLGTAPVLTAWTETPANLTTRTTAVYDTAAPLTSCPPGSNMPTLAILVNSAGYLVSYDFVTPAWVTTQNQVLWAELQFAMIGSTTTAVVNLMDMVAILSLALY